MRQALRALAARNLRLYFIGQGISLIGTWITNVASSWLAYRLTNSELILGVVAFGGQFPTALFGPFAGALVDTMDKRRVLLVTQALSMLQSFVLAYLAFSGQITVSQIIALNVFQALVNAFDTPARQSFLSELVTDRLDLPNAIALNAALFHGCRLIGPAIAGTMIAAAGEASCFLMDGFSYAAVLVSLLLIVTRRHKQAEKLPWRRSLKEGVDYAFSSVPIRRILTVVSICALLGAPHITLLPVIARDVLHGGPALYGNMMAAAGFGAFTGALFLASRDRGADIGRIVAPMPAVGGAGLLVVAYTLNPVISAAGLLVTGFSTVVMMAGFNSILQLIVEDSKRARMMAIYSSSFFGMLPLGGLIAGAAAHSIGAPLTVALGAGANFLVASHFAPKIRELLIRAPDRGDQS